MPAFMQKIMFINFGAGVEMRCIDSLQEKRGLNCNIIEPDDQRSPSVPARVDVANPFGRVSKAGLIKI